MRRCGRHPQIRRSKPRLLHALSAIRTVKKALITNWRIIAVFSETLRSEKLIRLERSLYKEQEFGCRPGIEKCASKWLIFEVMEALNRAMNDVSLAQVTYL